MFNDCKNTFCFIQVHGLQQFSVTDTDSHVALVLETYACAIIPPDADAIFSNMETNIYFCISSITKVELLKLYIFNLFLQTNVRIQPSSFGR